MRIIHSLYACMCADGTRSLHVHLWDSQPALRTHLAEALQSSGVARQCAEWTEAEKQGGHRGCYRHRANSIQVEDHQKSKSPNGPDEITRKTGNGTLDSVHLCARSKHRCYPAHAQPHQIETNYRSHHRQRQVSKMHPTC